ncbi:amidohydrolase family protein [Pseudooceanicola sp. CBS1P-1]|uniref:Amidohydrolase family protein n=1 Tax=Pseudooceanicola albus TaxID=2692189 RepID=A0A6L7G3V6_9RHOB|nr:MULTISPECIES: amidohydrolase family protein [Pseudooceanicola]MBT9384955.1 amidohydrolase family protein [Pseudooceanicola endophyticus]MXN18050.1 amidohydrolase family protein [Pseudooceanicola albus]
MLIANIRHGLTGRLGTDERFEGAIRIENGRIAEMGALRPRPGEEVLDATGCTVIPGLVNTHHHLFQSVLKAVPKGMNMPLDPWLMHVPYALWPLLDEETFRVAARIGLTELVLSGATTVADHHYVYSPRYDYDPSEVLFEEAARMGVRFVLGRGGMTRGRAFDDPAIPPAPCETLGQMLAGIEATAARWHDPSDLAMTRVAVAPTTPNFNLAPEELSEIARFARDGGMRLHCHLSENRNYADFTLAKYGKRPVPWLAEHDWLGEDVWFAHLVDLEPFEIEMLAETGAGMAHCPNANARLGSGIAPALALHRLGGRVSMGVDGAAANEAADMGIAMFSAFTLHRALHGAEALRAEEVLHWASAGGAAVLGLPKCGTLAPGMAADIALIDLSAPRNMGLHDPALAPVITGGCVVKHSLVGGRLIVRDGQPAGLDLGRLAEDATRLTQSLMHRAAQIAEPA